MNWKVEPFGELDGRPVEQITLKNSAQCSMQLLAYGATLRSFVLPSGLDVCLGYDTLDAYRTSDGYLGATIGRNSNRIGRAWMELDGHRFRLTSNEGRNQLHGGYRGFHAHLWEFEILENVVRFSRVSPDGEEGYPGTVQASVTYQLLDDGFAIEYAAETDRDTLVNLTNHSYFNLAGQGNGTVLDHILQMPAATQFLPVDAEKIPIGLLAPVTGTALDFLEPHAIGSRTDGALVLRPGDYDHAYALCGSGDRSVANLCCPRTGVALTVRTNMDSVQLYTAGGLAQRPGKYSAGYGPFSGICLETQRYPNAIQVPAFPSPLLRAGERYLHRSSFRFCW